MCLLRLLILVMAFRLVAKTALLYDLFVGEMAYLSCFTFLKIELLIIGARPR